MQSSAKYNRTMNRVLFINMRPPLSQRSPLWGEGGAVLPNMGYIYTLFDGLAYNTCGYFASCVVRGEEKYEQ